MGLLPRGDSKQGNVYPQPNKFTDGINKVNAALSSFAAGQNKLVYFDCTSQLIPDGKVIISSFTPSNCV